MDFMRLIGMSYSSPPANSMPMSSLSRMMFIDLSQQMYDRMGDGILATPELLGIRNGFRVGHFMAYKNIYAVDIYEGAIYALFILFTSAIVPSRIDIDDIPLTALGFVLLESSSEEYVIYNYSISRHPQLRRFVETSGMDWNSFITVKMDDRKRVFYKELISYISSRLDRVEVSEALARDIDILIAETDRLYNMYPACAENIDLQITIAREARTKLSIDINEALERGGSDKSIVMREINTSCRYIYGSELEKTVQALICEYLTNIPSIPEADSMFEIVNILITEATRYACRRAQETNLPVS